MNNSYEQYLRHRLNGSLINPRLSRSPQGLNSWHGVNFSKPHFSFSPSLVVTRVKTTVFCSLLSLHLHAPCPPVYDHFAHQVVSIYFFQLNTTFFLKKACLNYLPFPLGHSWLKQKSTPDSKQANPICLPGLGIAAHARLVTGREDILRSWRSANVWPEKQKMLACRKKKGRGTDPEAEVRDRTRGLLGPRMLHIWWQSLPEARLQPVKQPWALIINHPILTA